MNRRKAIPSPITAQMRQITMVRDQIKDSWSSPIPTNRSTMHTTITGTIRVSRNTNSINQKIKATAICLQATVETASARASTLTTEP